MCMSGIDLDTITKTYNISVTFHCTEINQTLYVSECLTDSV